MDVDALLRDAAQLGASDIHVAVEVPPALRIHGALQRREAPAVGAGEAEEALVHLAGADQLQRLRQQGEVDFSYSLPGVGRFRVTAFRQRGSVSLAIRPIPWTVPQMAELGAPDAMVGLARSGGGLVLVTGRAGSGKSTTVAAMVDLINRERHAHVITLEDPVEYLHRHRCSLVNQREIGVDSPGFATAMRSAMRSDPDVLVVGDLRDAETAQLALTAASTGQLVIGVVRQPDPASALEYLVSLFPFNQHAQVGWQLAGVLEGATGQVLLPRADGAGRVAAFEVLLATPAVRTLVREGKRQQIPAIMRAGVRYGMRTLEASWRDLCARGTCRADDTPPFPPAGAGGDPGG